MSKIVANITKHDTFLTHYIPVREYDQIYEHMMWLTGNDHEISADAACWCEDAPIGDEYSFREGYITIEEV